jgi:methylated-DNA-[protein]-cysteine S-methyltransferase
MFAPVLDTDVLACSTLEPTKFGLPYPSATRTVPYMSDTSHPSRHTVTTAWGVVILTETARGLAGVRLPDPTIPIECVAADNAAAPTATLARWGALFGAYFGGETADFAEIPLDDTGLSETERAIYAALRLVERGATVSYGDLAQRIGKPGAARAVGVAMARNRWPIVVPCHRVLATDGTLGGFSAPSGVATKRKLLALEGVDLDRGAPLLPGLFD